MTTTIKTTQVPHRYRNRFMRDGGSGSMIVAGGSGGGGIENETDPVFTAHQAHNITAAMIAVLRLLSVDEDGNIKVATNLWSTGGLTAFGKGDGQQPSGGGGMTAEEAEVIAAALNELNARINNIKVNGNFKDLLDVVALAFGSSDNGKTIVWNGTSWVKGTAGDKITKAAIEAVLTGNITTHTHSQYLTQHQDISGKQDKISDLATIRSNAENGQTAYGWGNHADEGYLTEETDPIFTGHQAHNITAAMIAVLNKLSLDADGSLKIDANTYATGGLSAFGKGTNEIVDNTARAAASEAKTAADKAQTDATKALTALGGISIVKCTQSTLPSTRDANTLYIVV